MNIEITKLENKIKEQEELILKLRAALSWQLAKNAHNPAFQAYLELQQEKDPKIFINPLGTKGLHSDLFL